MSTLDLSMCYGHIDTNQDCCVPYHSSSGTICIWKIAWSGRGQVVVRAWQRRGQSMVETWSGGGQSMAEICTSQARHVSATSQPQVPADVTCIIRK